MQTIGGRTGKTKVFSLYNFSHSVIKLVQGYCIPSRRTSLQRSLCKTFKKEILFSPTKQELIGNKGRNVFFYTTLLWGSPNLATCGLQLPCQHASCGDGSCLHSCAADLGMAVVVKSSFPVPAVASP